MKKHILSLIMYGLITACGSHAMYHEDCRSVYSYYCGQLESTLFKKRSVLEAIASVHREYATSDADPLMCRVCLEYSPNVFDDTEEDFVLLSPRERLRLLSAHLKNKHKMDLIKSPDALRAHLGRQKIGSEVSLGEPIATQRVYDTSTDIAEFYETALIKKTLNHIQRLVGLVLF